MTLNVETIEKLTQMKRPEILEVTQYGRYSSRKLSYVYDDGQKRYFTQLQGTELVKVHSKDALIEFINKELERRNNPSGDMSNLIINIDGGKFIADNNFNEGLCEYERITSQQWNILRSINGRILGHEEFLMSLLSLSPSVKNFREVYNNFLTLRVVGKSELTSNPVFVNNEAESGYLVKYKLEGRSSDTVIPDSFNVKIPYVKAGTKYYEIDVEIQVLNSNNNELRIKINIPTLDYIEERAILDEVSEIKLKMNNYDKMLILSDI